MTNEKIFAENEIIDAADEENNASINRTEPAIAYIIGNALEELSQLPNVYTVNQFLVAFFEHCLPKHSLWIIGQGISIAVRQILHLCATLQPDIGIHTGSLGELPMLQIKNNPSEEKKAHESLAIDPPLEWQNFRFVESTRIQAELKISDLSQTQLLTQDFLWHAAHQLSHKACQQILPSSQIVIKNARLDRFHQLFPLPITVETQFQLIKDNKRGFKSLTRFYQNYSCAAEVNLSFDLLSETEAQQLLQALGEKEFESFSEKMKK